MVLECMGHLSKEARPNLLKIDLSLLQRQSIPQEKHGSMHFSASVYWVH